MPRRGREFWQELIREYEAGNGRESHRAFAERRRVTVATFRQWLYRLRCERDAVPRLVPVRVVAPTAPTARWSGETAPAIEVALPSGVRLRLPVGGDVEYVATLIGRLVG